MDGVIGKVVIVTDQCFPTGGAKLRRNPDRPTLLTDLRLCGRGTVLCAKHIETGVEDRMLVCDLADHPLPLALLDVMIRDEKAGQPQTLEQRAAEWHWTNGASYLETLLVIDLGLVVILAVIETGVHVAVVAVEVVVT